MTINIPITLDLLYKRPPIVVHAVQNDENTRIIKASLTSNGTAFTPPVGATAEFRLVKPDGTYCFYDADENDNPAVTISGSIVSVVLLAPALQAAGLGKAQIDLYDADGRLATFAFILDIEAATVPDDAISEDYVNVITGLVTEAVTSAAAAEAAQAAAESAANGTVHFDVAQTLTTAQKEQARANIGAAHIYTSLADIGCSTSSTLANIAAAMPAADSVLVINRCGLSVNSGTTFSNALPANYGTLRVYGSSNNSGVCHFEFYRYRTTAGYDVYRKNIDASSGSAIESDWAYESELRTEALTLNTGWTANTAGRNQVTKQNNRCVLTISAKYTSAMSASSAVTIATVSSDFMPQFTCYGLLYGYHASTPTIDRVTVNTDGTVQIQGTTAANTSITGMIVYDA